MPNQAEPPFFVGVDVGGTSVKLGLVDNRGLTLADTSMPTHVQDGPEQGTRRMAEQLRSLIRQAQVNVGDVKRIGLATPGTMDIPAGRLVAPHNLPGWYDFPIRDRLAHYAGLPVTYANDATAACFGEYWRGTGEQFESLILLTLGTGIGGGIIIDDHVLIGQHSAGAECGHIVIDISDDARRCPCGGLGHLEAYTSAKAVVARTSEAVAAGAQGSLADRIRSGEELTPLLVAEEAEADDSFAREIVMETARYLGIGIVSLVHTIDPTGVVLGGAMTFGGQESPLGQAFLQRIREEVIVRGLATVTSDLRIEFASLGSAAGYIGAAGLARADYRRAA